MILYEFPFNERIRLLLRLEYLFNSVFSYADKADPSSQYTALQLLFEITDICERVELRSSLLLDLLKQKKMLEDFRGLAEIDEARLNANILQFEIAHKEFLASERVGVSIRENAWLTAVRSRMTTHGGSTPLDISSFCAWTHFPDAKRIKNINDWIKPFLPMWQGIHASLDLLRNFGRDKEVSMHDDNGVYQENLTGLQYQLMRIWLDDSYYFIYPEANANKYTIWLRFSQLNEDCSSQPYNQPLNFKLSLCAF